LISAPGTNVAIALGIDAMIHLVMALRRRLRAGENLVTAWRQAIAQQRPAIVGAMSIVAAGFAIFALSSFPATRRFGLLVASGSLVSALMALKVLPFLGSKEPFRKADRPRIDVMRSRDRAGPLLSTTSGRAGGDRPTSAVDVR